MFHALLRYFDVGDPSWTVRRRMAVATMLFCMATVLLCLLDAIDRELAKTTVSAAFTCLAAIPSIYSLSAVLDDHSKRATAAPRAEGASQ